MRERLLCFSVIFLGKITVDAQHETNTVVVTTTKPDDLPIQTVFNTISKTGKEVTALKNGEEALSIDDAIKEFELAKSKAAEEVKSSAA